MCRSINRVAGGDVHPSANQVTSRSLLSGLSLSFLIDSAADTVGYLSRKSSFENDLTPAMAFSKAGRDRNVVQKQTLRRNA